MLISQATFQPITRGYGVEGLGGTTVQSETLFDVKLNDWLTVVYVYLAWKCRGVKSSDVRVGSKVSQIGPK